eukprot:TRINITY_DN12365_c0_g1_i1.p1 TRINITY_DN12365_c0_g1~~TRINITY_DN12365_c0_g1_i1.p1  ORF type:complete len:203 (+),score=44.59 TRINITY_DN12365_c0_g1_i1:26-610(+)
MGAAVDDVVKPVVRSGRWLDRSWRVRRVGHTTQAQVWTDGRALPAHWYALLAACAAAAICSAHALWAASAVCVWGLFCGMQVQSEEVVIVEGVGAEARAQRYLGFRTRRFMPVEAMQDVVIHEGYRRHSVVSYVAFTPADPTQPLFLPFRTLLPPLDFASEVFKAAKYHLFDGMADPPPSHYERHRPKVCDRDI